MVRGKLTHFFAAIVLFCGSGALAGWSEPAFLPELNDYENGWAATTPRLTADQSVILFRRQALGTSEYTLFEAHRNPSTNIFENVRIVSELGSNGGAITWHWLSLDGLRLYYAEVVDINKIPQRVIRMAARNNINEQWRFVRTLMELHLKCRRYFSESDRR